MNIRKREFTAPNGQKRTFYFRDGTNDENCIIASFEQDYYEILKQDFMKGDVLIDLGAHVGGVTALMATIPDVTVYAVEALPENYELLNKNVEGLQNVLTYQKAIWDKDDLIKIFYGDQSTEDGRVHNFMGTINLSNSEEFAQVRESVEVKTLTLKDLFKINNFDRCRFMKIDVEGAEDKVLAHAPQSILNKIDIIRGEYHLGSYKNLFKKLNGFEDITPDSMNPDTNSLTEFMWRNNSAR